MLCGRGPSLGPALPQEPGSTLRGATAAVLSLPGPGQEGRPLHSEHRPECHQTLLRTYPGARVEEPASGASRPTEEAAGCLEPPGGAPDSRLRRGSHLSGLPQNPLFLRIAPERGAGATSRRCRRRPPTLTHPRQGQSRPLRPLA